MVEENNSVPEERVEKTIETEDKDMFSEVFGEDEDEKQAKKKLQEKAGELRKQKEKSAESAKESEEKEEEAPTEKKAKEEDEDDDGDEVEEEPGSSVEPVIFGEAEDEEFETKEEAFENVDAGGKRKKSKNNFDEMVNEGLEKSISGNGKNGSGKGMGGKLDLKVIQEEEEEEEEITPTHPVEKTIIKSVIKNKALMAAKSEVNLNKGKKISDDSLANRKDEDHDELADALLREEGTKEEGIEEEEEIEPVSGETRKTVMPIARAQEEENTENVSGEGKIFPQLEFLMSKEGHAFIGRKKSVLGKYGEEAGLFVGKVNEKDNEGTEVYLDGLNPHVVFVCGARGSGKCVTGDTLISLSDGTVLPIAELENNEQQVFGLDNELKIKSLQKVGFYERSVNKILHIKMRSGKEIKLTPEHPLLTINGWKPAEELPIGERIATPRVINSFGKETMSECEIKLLSYLIAEGHLGNQFVLFTNSDEKIVNDFTTAVKEFDENLKILSHGKYSYRISQKLKLTDLSAIKRNRKGQFTNEGHIICKKSSLMQWLQAMNLYEKRSKDKFIPEQIMKLKKEQLVLFINRLFSCDGSIHRINKTSNWQISYCSISEKMIRQLQHLLLRFGVLSKLRTKTTHYGKLKEKTGKAFELVLNGENAEKFMLEIGFFGEKEKREEIALQEMFSKKNNPNVDTIPKAAWDLLEQKNWVEMGKSIGYKNPKSLHNIVNYSPSRGTLQKIALIQQNRTLELLANSDIFWDEIVSVNEIKQETKVYDISVPSFSNFVANDIIVHNSYVLGVIAEELAMKNKNVGIIVVDPIGVFWSMKHPNKEEKELEALAKWGLMPRGLDNVKVFIPVGMKDAVPKSTYDAVFSIQPSLLTAEDWCLTFGIDRFSPTGLLMEKGIVKVKSGYTTPEGKEVRGKQNTFSLEDLVKCFEDDAELNDREKGYKADSIRALVSRFDAAKHWGIFDDKGTSLGLLSRAGQMTILDTSFLEDNVGALVIGILSRRLLAARKLGTRREAAGKFTEETDMEDLVELNIPPTWLFIDEAHTLIPGGNQKTPASSAIVEYVKQGRRPGCSLVFATQQPSAIDSKVLSQLDVIMAHKLVFDDDIKAIHKRTPAIVPGEYRRSNFIKTMPVGIALTGDRSETTSRAFIMAIRPRMSQHEGRDAETVEVKQELEKEQVEILAVNIALRQLEKDPSIRIESIQETLDTLNNTYKKEVSIETILEGLRKKGVNVGKEAIFAAGVAEEMEAQAVQKLQEAEEGKENKLETYGEKLLKAKKEFGKEAEEQGYEERVELSALLPNIDEAKARKIIAGHISKKFIFLDEEILDRLTMKYALIYKVKYKYYSHKEAFHTGEAYVDSLTGEFIHDDHGVLRESKGLFLLKELSEPETTVLKLVAEKKRSAKEVASFLKMEEGNAKRILEGLVKKELLALEEQNGSAKYVPNPKLEIDLPPNPLHNLLTSIGKRPIKEVETAALVSPNLTEKEVPELLKKLWGNIIVKEITHLFLPVWEGVLKKKTGEERSVAIDAINGNKINLAK
ncbi:MAG: LAGLIDADG family homing endonuclease [archaeon]